MEEEMHPLHNFFSGYIVQYKSESGTELFPTSLLLTNLVLWWS